MDPLTWRKQIQSDIQVTLDLEHKGFAHYCQFYGLDSLATRVELIKLVSNKSKHSWPALHFLQPPEKARGYALVTHGLFDHSAYMRPLIHSLLQRNLNVLSLELPGHGLDFKDALECDGFDEYTELNKTAEEWIAHQQRELLVEVSHSTGAIGRLNQLFSGKECLHKVVLLNPLVRIQMLQLARASYFCFSKFLSSFPRKKWGPGENREFLEFRKNDPFQVWAIPKSWSRHYFEWIDRVLRSQHTVFCENVLIAQGGRDFVVNSQASQKELALRLSNLKVSYYPQLAHQMLYGERAGVVSLLEEINQWWSDVGPNNF